MSTDTIETSIGRAPVLHRLALGIVVRDAVTDAAVTSSLRVGWEASGHLLPRDATDDWPCVDFETVGGGRYRLRDTPRRPALLTVRVNDPSRRYVSRRLSVQLWSHDELTDPLPANHIAVRSRTLQVWLWPGAAHPLPPGTTAIRGRVVRNGRAVPWTRVSGIGPTGTAIGRGHGDDRGEFIIRLSDTSQNPVQSSVPVRVIVRGPTSTPELPPIEVVTRPANPPAPGDLDNAVLRGVAPPAGHVLSIPPPPQFIVPVGGVHVPTSDIPFLP
ncbi:hypothetical protein [Microbacterium pumilum]|uniref:Carboxypeptidase regulatory-like domain-containing protein n=1 Tax=Microbacterium pumilum TaxID=344165 RepID=A0ABP5EHE7_9MICO